MLSEELTIKRKGLFTASENHKLMAGWDIPEPSRDVESFDELYPIMREMYDNGERSFLVGKMKKLTDAKVSGEIINAVKAVITYEKPSTGLVSYAEQKAAEPYQVRSESNNFSTPHTVNGNEREDECVSRLEEKLGIEIHRKGDDQVHIVSGNIGATPDGIIFNELDLVESGIEAKCKSLEVHAQLLLINNNIDLLDYSLEHYAQVQTGMHVTDCDHWHFAIYNPDWICDEMQFKSIVIDRDDRFIDALLKRAEIAAEIRDKAEKELLRSVGLSVVSAKLKEI